MRIAVSSWSFQKSLKRRKVSPRRVMETCVHELGLDAVEFVQSHLEGFSDNDLSALMKNSEKLGCQVLCLAASADLTIENGGKQRREVEDLVKWALWATRYGVPFIRVNSGHVELNGDAAGLMIGGIREVQTRCGTRGPVVVIENLGGPSECAANIVNVIRQINSTQVGACIDFGNFGHQDLHDMVQVLAPYAKYVHAKSYVFDSQGFETKINYCRVFDILRNVRYSGPVSIEFEGTGDELAGVKQTLALIHRILR